MGPVTIYPTSYAVQGQKHKYLLNGACPWICGHAEALDNNRNFQAKDTTMGEKGDPDAPTASPNAGGREREEARTSSGSEREGERKRGNNS